MLAPSSPPCLARLNISASGRECTGLTHVAVKSEADCAAACCARGSSSCTVYQWCPKGVECDGATSGDENDQCWIGKVESCDSGSRKGWVGFASSAVPPAQKLTVSDVRITHNYFSRNAKVTQATRALTQEKATQWRFDFCDILLYPVIAVAKIHVSAASGFPRAVARPTQNCSLLVETDMPVTGTITAEVDSSQSSGTFF